MNKKINILIILLALVLGFIIGNNKSRLISKKAVTQEKDERLESMIVLETARGTLHVLVEKEAIIFELFPAKDSGNFKNMLAISKKDYPKLFEDNFSFIMASVVDKTKVEISNNQPSHGGYLSNYRLIIDTVSGKIEEDITPRTSKY